MPTLGSIGVVTGRTKLPKQSLCKDHLVIFIFSARDRKIRVEARQGRPAAALCAVDRARSKAPLPRGVVFSVFWRSLESQADD